MDKKYTVWIDYGCEGWQPKDYDTIKECLEHESYGSPRRITKNIEYEAKEV